MQIGSYNLNNPLILAPMAGITDLVFRNLCLEFGANLAISEMLSANPDLLKTSKSKIKSKLGSTINAVQILGADPRLMALAAKINESNGADIIDINMGCPAKKVNKKLAGSALMRDLELVQAILEQVVSAVSIPVTLKIRTGWDLEHKNALDVAKIAEKTGISAITIHGRTRACMFKGKAEYNTIKEIKEQISIPVIANGDLNIDNAKDVLEYTSADGLMFGRAVLGNPWIFKQIYQKLNNLPITQITSNEKYQIILRHLTGLYELYGEALGILYARKHINWYIKNKEFKANFYQLNSPEKQLKLLEEQQQTLLPYLM